MSCQKERKGEKREKVEEKLRKNYGGKREENKANKWKKRRGGREEGGGGKEWRNQIEYQVIEYFSFFLPLPEALDIYHS